MQLTNAGAIRMLNGGGMISATQSVFVSLHSAEPTVANELTGANMARLELGPTQLGEGANFLRNAAVQNFVVPSQAIGDATHYALRPTATSDVILGWTAIVDDESPPQPVTLTVVSGTQVRIPALGVTIRVPLT